MTWLDVLLRDPVSLAKFAVERIAGSCCLDELSIFGDLGLVEHTDCPCCDKVPSDEKGVCDCFSCEFQFLTNPEIYEKSISEVYENG